ncbi:hypothetical protein D3C71_1681610 [compost metagenome]
MLCIDPNAALGKLAFQPPTGHGIAQKQRLRVFVIDEEAAWIARRLQTTLFNGDPIILFIFHHVDAVIAQLLLFPFAGIRRHVHADAKAEASADNADRHAKVASRPYGNAIAAEKLAELRRKQLGVVIRQLKQPGFQSQLFRMRQHLVNTPASLD